MAGFEHASGETIVTLPAYHQIEGARCRSSSRRWAPATSRSAGAGRGPAARSSACGVRSSTACWRRSPASRFQDLGCGARAFDRRVLEEIQLYGDQHRFLAVLADRQGFRVREVDVRQSPKDRYAGIYGPREYTRGLLDIFTVFFLVRFTKKPLRFFGMVGVSTFVIGALLVTWIVIERLFFGQPLAERPALLLSSLLVVLGLQLFALGLLGELIIFTHARCDQGLPGRSRDRISGHSRCGRRPTTTVRLTLYGCLTRASAVRRRDDLRATPGTRSAFCGSQRAGCR